MGESPSRRASSRRLQRQMLLAKEHMLGQDKGTTQALGGDTRGTYSMRVSSLILFHRSSVEGAWIRMERKGATSWLG